MSSGFEECYAADRAAVEDPHDAGRGPEPGRLHFGRGKRLPVILQSEAAECGLACVAMVAGYHGRHIGMPTMRQKFPVSLKGSTLSSLMEVAQLLGLQARAVRLDINELAKLQLPCILHWNMSHFVVLRQVTAKAAVIHDPLVGVRKVTLEDLERRFTGVALELFAGTKFRRQAAEPALSLMGLAGTVSGLTRSLLQILAMALALEIFVLLGPIFTQVVVDQVLADSDRDLLTLLGISFTVLLLLQVAIGTLRTWTVMWLSTNFNLAWTGNVFSHLMRLPQGYFLKRHLGDIVSRFGAISSIQQTLTTRFVEVVIDGMMAVVTLVMMGFYSVRLTLITCVSVAIYGTLRSLYFRAYRQANLSQVVLSARQQSAFMEAARGVQTLRIFNQGAAQTARYLNAATDTLNCSIAVQRLTLLFGSMSRLALGLQRILVLWIGASFALAGHFSAGMLIAFLSYADQFAQKASATVDYLVEFKLLHLQGERLADIVMTPPEAHVAGSYVGPEPVPSIRFKGVSYRYAESEPLILRDASFEIRPGESVAIVGASGCGKSTLLRLLLGLIDPLLGAIEVGGMDIRHLGKQRFRQMVSSVLQDDTLFSGSIAENISFFDQSAKPEAVEAAAIAAELHEDIRSMPMGYHTLVGDMGSTLSGGQRQRLLLARALYARPKILVLDEATSNLDVEREKSVNRRLAAMDITRIIVAHRPETIASADRVLVLTGGAIKEAVLKKPAEASASALSR